jgi:hypothetical protein
MAILYYNAAVDTDWSTLGNWWTDSSFSTPASYLPSSGDYVEMYGNCLSNSGNPAVVDSFYTDQILDINITANGIDQNTIWGSVGYNGVINVLNESTTNAIVFNGGTNYGIVNSSGKCNFYGGANYGTINAPNCEFSQTGFNGVGGNVIADCIFESAGYVGYSAYNAGSISGVCTFSATSKNIGTITGNCTFNNDSYNENPGTITGNVTFNNNSHNGALTGSLSIVGGEIIGDVIFNDDSRHSGMNYGDALITGNITYNDFAIRQYSTSNSNMVVFNDNSSNEGGYFNDIDGSSNSNAFVIFNDGSSIWGGFVSVSQIMNDSSYITYSAYGSEVSNTFNDNSYVSFALGAGGFPAVWTFNDNSYIDSNSTFYDNGGDRTFNPTMIFNHNSHTDCLDLDVNTATFNDSSYNNGNIVGNSVTFKDSSYNSASGVITGDEVYNDRTPYPIPRGINGSSILGII